MTELPFVGKVDVLAIRIGHPPTQGVEDGGPSAEIPLLDQRRVKIDILMTCGNLPDLTREKVESAIRKTHLS